ncbi:hypothetical protein GA0061101_1618 [Rhizobium lusitanum]|uniref:Uncharacterized protein n=3 Tax=Rhizobium TaxID=379 RepID=A0A1C3XLX7_9HYPH|nr:hypothetical protein GA0061101_1618 [Rhizobium lusitanum]
MPLLSKALFKRHYSCQGERFGKVTMLRASFEAEHFPRDMEGDDLPPPVGKDATYPNSSGRNPIALIGAPALGVYLLAALICDGDVRSPNLRPHNFRRRGPRLCCGHEFRLHLVFPMFRGKIAGSYGSDKFGFITKGKHLTGISCELPAIYSDPFRRVFITRGSSLSSS